MRAERVEGVVMVRVRVRVRVRAERVEGDVIGLERLGVCRSEERIVGVRGAAARARVL